MAFPADAIAALHAACGYCCKRIVEMGILGVKCPTCLKIAYCSEEHLKADEHRHRHRCGTETCAILWKPIPERGHLWQLIQQTHTQFDIFIFEANYAQGGALIRTDSNDKFCIVWYSVPSSSL